MNPNSHSYQSHPFPSRPLSSPSHCSPPRQPLCRLTAASQYGATTARRRLDQVPRRRGPPQGATTAWAAPMRSHDGARPPRQGATVVRAASTRGHGGASHLDEGHSGKSREEQLSVADPATRELRIWPPNLQICPSSGDARGEGDTDTKHNNRLDGLVAAAAQTARLPFFCNIH